MSTEKNSSIQFFDNFVPKLHAGTYQISVSQTLVDSGGTQVTSPLTSSQQFDVMGPQYLVPAADVHAVFPPNNHSGCFEENLPHIVFTKKALPWELIFDENNENVPWMALLVCQIGSGASATATVSGGQVTAISLSGSGAGYHELPPTVSIIDTSSAGSGATATATVDPTTGAITGFTVVNPGSGYSSTDTIVRIGYPKQAGNPVSGANQTGSFATTVATVISPGSDLNGNPILGPSITAPATSTPTPCQAINVNVNSFAAYLPKYDTTGSTVVDEVSPLAHVRQVDLQHKAVLRLSNGWCSNLIAKRFPVAPAGPVNYAVHVISLLGLRAYLKTTPDFGSSDLIQLISLYSWSFTCQPESGETFRQLMLDLTTTEGGTGYLLRLPMLPMTRGSAPIKATAKAAELVMQGYVPLTYNTRQGEQTMALYRSPLTPVLPQNTTKRLVTDIKMLDKGSGYTTVPAVNVSGGGILPATALPPTLSGLVEGNTVTVSSGGNGYVSPPKISFNCASLVQAKASATIGITGNVNQIIVNNPGAGYSSVPDVVLDGGGIKAAQASTFLQVQSINLLNGGSGYSAAPRVIISGGGGTGAAAVAVMNGGSVASITLLARGQGYTAAPTISFVPTQGSAAATAVMTLQSEVQMANGGFGYTSVPEVILSGGLPTAAATVALSEGSVDPASVVISQPGAGYTSAPTVTLSGGLDEAMAVAQVAGGSIVGAQLLAKGSNYSTSPVVAPAGSNTSASLEADINGLLSVQVSNGGAGYVAPVTFAFSGSPTRAATATAILSTGSIIAVPVTNPGSGYNGTAPEVSFTGGNGDAVAVAVLTPDGDSVANIRMTNCGNGYADTATVNLSAVNGATAATLGAPVVSPVGSITRVIINDTGAGYSGTVTASATSAGGGPATAATFGAVTIGSGMVTQVRVVNGGTGYDAAPDLLISGGGVSPALATASIDSTTGAVTGLNFSSTGSGYAAAPVIAFSGGGLTSATATAIINNGQVTGVQITNSGQGYTTAPTLGFVGGGFALAAATAVLSGAQPNTIAAITVTAQGYGYAFPPNVIISGGGVREAQAVATLTSGVVSQITITDPGEGYTEAPTAVNITGGIRPLAAQANLERVVQNLTPTQGGSGYTSAPVVTIAPPSGSALIAYISPTAPSTVAQLTATADQNIAFEFTSGTTFTINGSNNMDGTYLCCLNAAWVGNVLTVFIDTSTLALPPVPNISGGVLSPATAQAATAIAEITNGIVSRLVLTSAGSGYTDSPLVTIAPPETGTDNATASATVGTQVGSLTIIDPGSGYTYAPDITIAAPVVGTTASAQAYVNEPIGSSSAVAVYNNEWGVFDLSYSSTFLNARMLALSSKTFAVNVLQWRRDAHRLVNTLYERLTTADRAALESLSPGQLRTYMQGGNIVTEQFMAALTGDFAKQIIPKFSQPVQAGSIVNLNIPPAPTTGAGGTAVADLKALLQNGDVQTQLQNLSGYSQETGTFSNPRFQSICEWLASLVLLEGVAFEQLVPDQRMLPPSSIRFFYLDPNAMEAMIDGALSVGTHSTRDTLYYSLMQGVVRDAVTTLLHQTRANLLGVQPTSPPYNDSPITGLLLRSPVVKGWPGLEVKAYKRITTVDGQPEGTGKVPLLRMSHLAKDILLCLFDGVPEWVELDEPSEGLTFGIEDGALISLRQLTGDETGAQIVLPDGEFAMLQAASYIDTTTGALQLTNLIAALQGSLASELTPNLVVRVETDGGEGYTSPPTTITVSGTANSNITAQMNGLAGVVVGNGGTGYTVPPTVTITDAGSGSGASAIATVENGSVTAIQLLSLGENYTQPAVQITSANPGTGVSATASLDANSEISIALTNGGSGYSAAPLVTLTPAQGDPGTGAAAVAVLEGDTVVRVTVTSQGRNYKSAPSVSFNSGSGASASALVASGQITGFSFLPSALGTFNTAPEITVEGGTYTQQATATAYLGTLSPADFAVQMVKLPERMIFRVPQ